jgi:hypothetical protein
VDEVLSVGDYLFQRKCINMMRAFQRQGKTIIVASHSLAEVSTFCTRLFLLRDGELAMEGTTDAVIKAYVEECEQTYSRIEAPIERDHVLSVHENRTEGARIVEIHFLDRDMNPRTEFDTGEEINIRLRFASTNGPLSDPCIRVQFLRSDGLFVFGMNNYRQDCRLKGIDGHFEVMLNYPSLNLLSGDYYVNVGIWPDEYKSYTAKAPYDSRDYVNIIRVRQKREHGGGLAYVPCKMTARKLDSQT